MSVLGREILGARRGKRQAVRVDEWDGEILLRKLSFEEAQQIQSMAQMSSELDAVEARTGMISQMGFELIRASWINEDGTPVLTENDRAALMAESNAAIMQIVQEIRSFNALDEDAAEQAAKN